MPKNYGVFDKTDKLKDPLKIRFFTRPKVALVVYFYRRDIGRDALCRHLRPRFIRGHRVELTAPRNLIKIYIGSAPALPAFRQKMAGVDDHRCFNQITVSGTVRHYAVMCDSSR